MGPVRACFGMKHSPKDAMTEAITSLLKAARISVSPDPHAPTVMNIGAAAL